MAKSDSSIMKIVTQNPHCLLAEEISGNDRDQAIKVLEQIKAKGKLNHSKTKYLKSEYNEFKR